MKSGTRGKVLVMMFSAIACLLLASVTATPAAHAQTPGRWVTAWATSPHAPLHFPGLAPMPTYTNQTLRMVVRPELGGDTVRIRLSNEFGASALKIGAVHLALLDHDAVIVAQSDRTVTFGGAGSVTIPAGAPALSDPVSLHVRAFAEVAVSVFVPGPAPADTMHLLGQHETYVSGPGDATASADLTAISSNHTWVWLDRLEVQPSRPAAAVVALGDSITDGFASTPGAYRDWPDQLAQRLAQDSKGMPLAVLNEGIGGNRILHDGAGVSALARLDRDVLSHPGVTEVILLEGINDFGWPHMKIPPGTPPGAPILKMAEEDVSPAELIQGMRQVIARAHEHGIRVFGATILPFEGADYFSPEGEQKRQEVNRWMRTDHAFDGVIDLDAAVRDPEHPTRLLDRYQSGDHLHPNDAGYAAMADSINLQMLRQEAKQPR